MSAAGGAGSGGDRGDDQEERESVRTHSSVEAHDSDDGDLDVEQTLARARDMAEAAAAGLDEARAKAEAEALARAAAEAEAQEARDENARLRAALAAATAGQGGAGEAKTPEAAARVMATPAIGTLSSPSVAAGALNRRATIFGTVERRRAMALLQGVPAPAPTAPARSAAAVAPSTSAAGAAGGAGGGGERHVAKMLTEAALPTFYPARARDVDTGISYLLDYCDRLERMARQYQSLADVDMLLYHKLLNALLGDQEAGAIGRDRPGGAGLQERAMQFAETAPQAGEPIILWRRALDHVVREHAQVDTTAILLREINADAKEPRGLVEDLLEWRRRVRQYTAATGARFATVAQEVPLFLTRWKAVTPKLYPALMGAVIANGLLGAGVGALEVALLDGTLAAFVDPASRDFITVASSRRGVAAVSTRSGRALDDNDGAADEEAAPRGPRCWHCNEVGHYHVDCPSKADGKSPHPDSRLARGPMHWRPRGGRGGGRGGGAKAAGQGRSRGARTRRALREANESILALAQRVLAEGSERTEAVHSASGGAGRRASTGSAGRSARELARDVTAVFADDGGDGEADSRTIAAVTAVTAGDSREGGAPWQYELSSADARAQVLHVQDAAEAVAACGESAHHQLYWQRLDSGSVLRGCADSAAGITLIKRNTSRRLGLQVRAQRTRLLGLGTEDGVLSEERALVPLSFGTAKFSEFGVAGARHPTTPFGELLRAAVVPDDAFPIEDTELLVGNDVLDHLLPACWSVRGELFVGTDAGSDGLVHLRRRAVGERPDPSVARAETVWPFDKIIELYHAGRADDGARGGHDGRQLGARKALERGRMGDAARRTMRVAASWVAAAAAGGDAPRKEEVRSLLDFCRSFVDDLGVAADALRWYVSAHFSLARALQRAGALLNRKKLYAALQRGPVTGHILCPEGIEPDPEKVRDLVQAPAPRTMQGVQGILGLAQYNADHVDRLSEILEPISALTRTRKDGSRADITAEWGDEQETARLEVIARLVTTPALATFTPDGCVVYACDASRIAAGVVAKQLKATPDGGSALRAIGYASRTFDATERGRHAAEREIDCVIWAVDVKFKHWSAASEHIVIVTDALMLIWLFARPNVNSTARDRLQRWTLTLQQYDNLQLVHIPGRWHEDSDYMSRLLDEIVTGEGFYVDTSTADALRRVVATLPAGTSQSGLDAAIRRVVRASQRERTVSCVTALDLLATYPDEVRQHPVVMCAAVAAGAVLGGAAARRQQRTSVAASSPAYAHSPRRPASPGRPMGAAAGGAGGNAAGTADDDSDDDRGGDASVWNPPEVTGPPSTRGPRKRATPDPAYERIGRAEVVEAQRHDETMVRICAWLRAPRGGSATTGDERPVVRAGFRGIAPAYALGEDGALLVELAGRGLRLAMPEALRRRALQLAHKTPGGGHLHAGAVVERLLEHYYWPGMTRDARAEVRDCAECREQRPPGPHTGQHEFRATHTAEPFGEVAIDFCGPFLPDREGHRYALVMNDSATKMPSIVATAYNDAERATRGLVEHWVAVYGIPAVLRSDRGSEFCNEVMAEVLSWFHMRPRRTPAEKPESNGSAERSHRTIFSAVRKLVRREPQRWGEYLKCVQLAINTSRHRVTGVTPFYATFGRNARVMFEGVELERDERGGADVSSYGRRLMYHLRRAWQDIDRALHEQSARDSKRQSGRMRRWRQLDKLSAGDRVLRLVPKRKRTKLDPVMDGPFEVVRALDDAREVFELRRPGPTRGRPVIAHRRDLAHTVPHRATGEGVDFRGVDGQACHTCGEGGDLRRCVSCTRVYCARHRPSVLAREWSCEECNAPSASESESDTTDSGDDEPAVASPADVADTSMQRSGAGLRPTAAQKAARQKERAKVMRDAARQRNFIAWTARGGHRVNQLGCTKCRYREKGCSACRHTYAVRAAQEEAQDRDGAAAVVAASAPASLAAAQRKVRAAAEVTGEDGERVVQLTTALERRDGETARDFLRRIEAACKRRVEPAPYPGLADLIVRIFEAHRVLADQYEVVAPRMLAPAHTARMLQLRDNWVPWTCGRPTRLHGARRWAYNAYMATLQDAGRIEPAPAGESLRVSMRAHIIPKPHSPVRPGDSDPEGEAAAEVLRVHMAKRTRDRRVLPLSDEARAASRVLRKRWRLVFDARPPNEETLRLRASKLPAYRDMLHELGGHRLLTVADVEDGFHSLTLPEGDRWKTVFPGLTEEFPGFWQMTCAQMGSKNTAEVFHNVIATIVREAPPVVWPLRAVRDDEGPVLSVRSSEEVPGPDAEAVRAVREEARAYVARWERAASGPSGGSGGGAQ